jgi:hypothetical protein
VSAAATLGGIWLNSSSATTPDTLTTVSAQLRPFGPQTGNGSYTGNRLDFQRDARRLKRVDFLVRKKSAMSNESVRLFVDGTLLLPNLQTAIDAFIGLLDSLARSADPDTRIDWKVSKIQGGSLTLESTPTVQSTRQKLLADRVFADYDHVGEAMERGDIDSVPENSREYAIQLSGLVGGTIPRITLGSNGRNWVVEKPIGLSEPEIAEMRIRAFARTSVRGRIQTLSGAQGMYFTLREAHTDRTVKCYPQQKHRPLLADSWKANAWIVVEGLLHRTVEPLVMSEITEIVQLPHAEPEDWRKAMGCID